MSFFSNPDAVARYAEGPVRLVSGFDGLQRMTTLLLREQVPATGNVLVQDAGFEDVELFYAGFSFKGWVGYKPR
ncbi:hypothetical protein AZH11_20135 [Pseudomonas simiae]|nr:hypothetical protein AZH11_20135 [Pseudomonas simiae]